MPNKRQRKKNSKKHRKNGGNRNSPASARQAAEARKRVTVQPQGDMLDDQEPDASQTTQGGDTQGLSPVADATFESVKELVEEGQYLEAEVVDGVENAPTSDQGEVKTKEVPEDDVPPEYRVLPNRERQS
jgi:hypothetical protein